MWLNDLLTHHNTTGPSSSAHKEVGPEYYLATIGLSDMSESPCLNSGRAIQKISTEIKTAIYSEAQYNTLDSARQDALHEVIEEHLLVTHEQKAHARYLLVNCPIVRKSRHCWHCSRCGRSTKCSMWWGRREEVELFRKSDEPYSLYVAEMLLQKD